METNQLQTIEMDTSKMIANMQTKITDLVIDDDDAMSKSSDMAKQLTQLLKKVNEEEKKYTKPLNDTLKRLRDNFRPSKEKIDGIITALKQKQTKYLLCKKRREEELAQKRKEEFEAQALNIAEDMEKQGLKEQAEEVINTVANYQPQAVKVSSVGSIATSYIKRAIDFEVVDISKVNNYFLMVNDKAVKDFIAKLKFEIEIKGKELGLKSDALTDYVYKEIEKHSISGIKIKITETVQTR